jgi:hypothetical protein
MTQHPFKSQQHMPKKGNDSPSVKIIYISQCKDKVGNQKKVWLISFPKDKQNRKKINDETKFKQKKKMQPIIWKM